MGELLDYTEAAKVLGLRLSTLYSLVFERRVPHIRLGKRLVRFDRGELEQWVHAHRVQQSDGGAQ